jgi:hypothetical protein
VSWTWAGVVAFQCRLSLLDRFVWAHPWLVLVWAAMRNHWEQFHENWGTKFEKSAVVKIKNAKLEVSKTAFPSSSTTKMKITKTSKINKPSIEVVMVKNLKKTKNMMLNTNFV